MSNLVEFVDGDMTEEDRKKIDELLIKIDEENELPEKIGKLEAENARLREALKKEKYYLGKVDCYILPIADEADYFAKVRIDEILKGEEE